MPKYKIGGENGIRERELDVELEIHVDGAVTLLVNRSFILDLNPDGTITLYQDVDDNIGLQLDDRGCIIINKKTV